MKKYIISAVCLIALMGVLLTRESNFGYANSQVPQTLEIHDPQSTLLFVGDIMLGRNVENLMKTYSSDYPFHYIDTLLQPQDAVVANLEGPIVDPHIQTPPNGFNFSFASTTAELLKNHNISIVNLANNHTDNAGTAGFSQTLTFLHHAGVLSAGNPHSVSADYILQTIINNQPFIFVGFNLTDTNLDHQAAFKLIADQQAEKTAHHAFLVAMVHGGTEYSLHSNTTQEAFDHGLIDAGADVVIAHHPHVVEEIELYKNKLIFYSLGNFIFDQYFSPEVQQELGVQLQLTPQQEVFNLIPIISSQSQPHVMTSSSTQTFLEALAARSSPQLTQAITQGTLIIQR